MQFILCVNVQPAVISAVISLLNKVYVGLMLLQFPAYQLIICNSHVQIQYVHIPIPVYNPRGEGLVPPSDKQSACCVEKLAREIERRNVALGGFFDVLGLHHNTGK